MLERADVHAGFERDRLEYLGVDWRKNMKTDVQEIEWGRGLD